MIEERLLLVFHYLYLILPRYHPPLNTVLFLIKAMKSSLRRPQWKQHGRGSPQYLAQKAKEAKCMCHILRAASPS